MSDLVIDPFKLASAGRLLFNDPCDNFTFAPWTAAGSTAVVGSGQAGNGFDFPAGSGNTATYNIGSGDQTDTLTIGFHVNFTTLAASQQTLLFFRSDSNATTHNALRADSTGRLYVTRSTATVIVTSASSLVTTGTWYRVELSVTLHDTAGAVTLKLGGSSIGTFSGDTKNAGTKTVYDTVVFTGQSGSAQKIDNIYLRNDGTFLG